MRDADWQDRAGTILYSDLRQENSQTPTLYLSASDRDVNRAGI
jgi:hypothetical protein